MCCDGFKTLQIFFFFYDWKNKWKFNHSPHYLRYPAILPYLAILKQVSISYSRSMNPELIEINKMFICFPVLQLYYYRKSVQPAEGSKQYVPKQKNKNKMWCFLSKLSWFLSASLMQHKFLCIVSLIVLFKYTIT